MALFKKKEEKKKKHGFRNFLAILLILIAVAIVVVVLMLKSKVSEVYEADQEAYNYLAHPRSGISVDNTFPDETVFVPNGGNRGGVIIYPGDGISEDAYLPLAEKIAEKGVVCIVVQMPNKISILGADKADKARSHWPDVKRWIVVGHAEGANAAEEHVLKRKTAYAGIVLLGARMTRDFSESDIKVLQILATEDKICSPEYAQKTSVPNPKYIITDLIQGGCHSYFGMYGMQKGDGKPTISWEEQMNEVVDEIDKFITSAKALE